MKMKTFGKYTDLVKPLFEENWFNEFKPFLDSKDFDNIIDFLKKERSLGKYIVPLDKDCFKAFKECSYKNLKIVILGQDPYPGTINNNLEADGLAFSYTKRDSDDIYTPKSLKVILEEVQRDIYDNETEFADFISDTNLKRWANQGVLLLNTSLTTLLGFKKAHINLWNPFMEYLFKNILSKNNGLIYMLWGKEAESFEKLINSNMNYILKAPHPAAQFYSGGKITFKNCRHFSMSNKIIKENNGRDLCIRW